MKFGVFGTGMVGLAISNRLEELGHEVMIGTRDPSKSAEKLKSKKKAVKVGTFAQAAAFGERLTAAVRRIRGRDFPARPAEGTRPPPTGS